MKNKSYIIILPLFQSSLSHMSTLVDTRSMNEDKEHKLYSFNQSDISSPFFKQFYKHIPRTVNCFSYSQNELNLQTSDTHKRGLYKCNKFIPNKMSYYQPINNKNIFKRMYKANWRSGKFPDGSLEIKSSAIPIDQVFKLVIKKYRNEDQERVRYLSSDDNKNYTDIQPTYIDGRRCGIIPVDIRQVEGKEIVSFLTVLGKPTRDDRGRMINIYSFAKGRMEPHETHAECASREFWEETGIKLKGVELLPRINIGKNIYFIFHTTKETLSRFDQIDRREVERVEWKTYDELCDIVSTSHILPFTANKDIRQVIRYPQRTFPFHRTIYTKPKGTRDDPLFDLVKETANIVTSPTDSWLCARTMSDKLNIPQSIQTI